MALLTPQELKKLPFYIRNRHKHKCDFCRRVILSSLIYGAVDGKEACSESCKNNLNTQAEKDNMLFANKKKKDEEEDEKSEVSESSESSESSSESEKKTDKNKKAVKPGKKEKAAPAKKAGRPAGKKKNEEEKEEKPAKKDKKEDKKSSKKDKEKKTRESTVGTAKNPFREGSMVFEGFEMAKEGCTVKAMKKFCEKKGKDYNWLMARFKKETKRGVDWKFTIDEDDMKIKLKK